MRNWLVGLSSNSLGRKEPEEESHAPFLSLILLSLCHSPVREVYFTLAVFTNFLMSAGLPVHSHLSSGLHKFETIAGVSETQNSAMAKWY